MFTDFRLPQGWHPIIIISQIICLQSIHYLALCLIIPPLLTLLADPYALAYEGGAANVGMIMDWREMVGRPTMSGLQGENTRGWSAFRGAYSGGKKLGGGVGPGAGGTGWAAEDMWKWDGGMDPVRGWVIACCWMVASIVDVYTIYALVRRPTHVLDFSLTLLLIHIILTTYYSSSLPSSLFFWIVMFAGAAVTVIFAEQLCVRREMREGIGIAIEPADSLEMGNLRRD